MPRRSPARRPHPTEILARWRAARPALQQALRDYPAGEKMPWFGPPMSPTSMATARFMETWAHALDVAEALGQSPQPTDRIRHVAHLGVRTRNFAFGVHGLEPPAEEFRIELTAPSGEVWEWGPADAAQSVRGSAQDFCLRVTQRRHRDDLDLVADRPGRGPLARPGPGVRRSAGSRQGGGDDAPSRRLLPRDAPQGPVRIANCSGFYGDRLSAMREMLDGGSIDVVTGDYLAELTMLILGRDRMRDPSLGYAKTFVRQVEDCLGTALERGVKIVSNAGGLNPAGLVEKLQEVASGLGLDPAIAWVDGDDLRSSAPTSSASAGRSPPTPTSVPSASPVPSRRAPTSW